MILQLQANEHCLRNSGVSNYTYPIGGHALLATCLLDLLYFALIARSDNLTRFDGLLGLLDRVLM